MRITDEKLIDIWRFFQYRCLPSIIMAKYAYQDYIGDIKAEKPFYRHKIKQSINKVGKHLDALPNQLMSISNQNIQYMNILGDNIEELLQDDTAELYKSVYLSFRNAKFKPLECLTALHYISIMIQMVSSIFTQCCKDIEATMKINCTQLFHVYNLDDVFTQWDNICNEATVFYGYDKEDGKSQNVDLNNPRCIKAALTIRNRYYAVDTLSEAMRKSYRWSPNYIENLPFEQSLDYFIITGGKTE